MNRLVDKQLVDLEDDISKSRQTEIVQESKSDLVSRGVATDRICMPLIKVKKRSPATSQSCGRQLAWWKSPCAESKKDGALRTVVIDVAELISSNVPQREDIKDKFIRP